MRKLFRRAKRFVKRYPHVIMAATAVVMLCVGQIEVALVIGAGAVYEHVRTQLLLDNTVAGGC